MKFSFLLKKFKKKHLKSEIKNWLSQAYTLNMIQHPSGLSPVIKIII